MTAQEINRIQTFLGSDYEVKQVGNVALIEKKEEQPIEVYNGSAYFKDDGKDTQVTFVIDINSSAKSQIIELGKDLIASKIANALQIYLNRKP